MKFLDVHNTVSILSQKYRTENCILDEGNTATTLKKSKRLVATIYWEENSFYVEKKNGDVYDVGLTGEPFNPAEAAETIERILNKKKGEQ